MAAKPDSRFRWKMPLFGVLAAVVAFLPIMLYGNDLGASLATFVLFISAASILLTVAAFNARRQTMAALAMLASFGVATWILVKFSYEVHERAKWLAQAGRYKSEVLAQPPPTNGQLRHIEWDGWGWAGGETVVYLVFDQDDRLSVNRRENVRRPAGIPCDVWRIHRLERHWYAVTFYTDTVWDQCM